MRLKSNSYKGTALLATLMGIFAGFAFLVGLYVCYTGEMPALEILVSGLIMLVSVSFLLLPTHDSKSKQCLKN